MGQRLHLHSGSDAAAFHGVGLHELHTGGGVEEQITDDDGGTVGTSGFRFFHDISCLQTQTGAGQAAGSFGHQINTADGCDGSQRFATEAHGADGGQVFCGAQLGGGMAQESRFGILLFHAAAVVGDSQEGHAAVLDFHGNFGSTGIHGIFQQFFHNAGRTFHHLTGGDQIGNMGG